MALPEVKILESMSPLDQLTMPAVVRQGGKELVVTNHIQEDKELVATNQVQLMLFNKLAEMVQRLRLENNELKKQLKIATNNLQTVSADLYRMQRQSQRFVE
jgi:hypothetical protein